MRKKSEGATHDRQKGLKYFNKVGYQGFDNKPVPRWATDDKLLAKVINYQKQTMNPDKIFGKLNPQRVEAQFNLEKVFSKGLKADAYEVEEFERGSSANWNDNSEFKSVMESPGRAFNHHKSYKAMQEVKNLSVSAGPFGLKAMDLSEMPMNRLEQISENEAESKSKRVTGRGFLKTGSFARQSMPLQHTENEQE